MADGQGPISPQIAQQLMASPLVQEDSTREQLGAIAAPLVNEPQEIPMAAQEDIPESKEEFVEGLTEVPQRIDPVIEEKAKEAVAASPESMSRADREKLIEERGHERMMERINSGEVSQEEALRYLRAKRRMDQTKAEDVERLDASKLEGRQQIVQEKYERFLEDQSARDEFNALAKGVEGLVEKPEANILEHLSEDELRFAAQSGMDIPPAAAYKAEKELEQLELAKETEKQAATQRTLAAEQEATKRVAVEEQQKQQARIQQAAQDVEKEDEELRRDFTSLGELFSEGTLGQRIGTAIAIAFGGIAQGMTGASMNPVMAVLDKEFARNDAKKQHALALVKEQIKSQANKMKDAEQALKFRKLSNEIDLQERQLKAKRQMDKIVQQGGEVPEQLLTTIGADKDSRDRIVRGPGGKAYVADTKQAADGLRKFKDDTEPGINTLNELIDMNRNMNKLSPTERAAAYSKLNVVVGSLREAIVGPGAMTEAEYERLRTTLGDPTKILTLSSIEEAKLKAVRDVLQNNVNTRFRNAGINLPLSRDEKIIDQTMRANPGKDKASVIRALRKMGKIQ